jgi:beta-1,4-mannosyltransferase
MVSTCVQVLLDAAVTYDAAACCRPGTLAPLIILVTGRGPGKAAYLRAMRHVTLTNVAIRTGWLSAADYPTLLAAADLGVSLHTSSSDLDLPMKVADMLGRCAEQTEWYSCDCRSRLVGSV